MGRSAAGEGEGEGEGELAGSDSAVCEGFAAKW